MKTVHKSTNAFKCNHCDKTFNTKNEFTEHKKTVHEDLTMDVGLNKEVTTNNLIDSSKSKEMTFQYHLRNRGVPEKQKQQSKFSSV